jgi:hypothetical protein
MLGIQKRMSDTLYDQALFNMEKTVHTLAARVVPPTRVPYKDTFVFRYVEKTLHQAIVQKLARYVSGLYAARLLMEHGFVQEQGALQRILDEIQEDISFLSFPVIFSEITDLHKRYLEAFYEEEFDKETAYKSTQKRPMIRRQKIRAYIARMNSEHTGFGQTESSENARTVSKGYSGYVHAASPHIMDMYGGDPPRFHVSGMLYTPRHTEHRRDLWNYFYRGIISCSFAAKAFGEDELVESISDFILEFEKKDGKNYSEVENKNST